MTMINEERPVWAKELDRQNEANRIVNNIIQDLYSHFGRNDERPFVVDAFLLHNYQWHNPQKGETKQGEMDRWFEFLKINYNITHRYDHITDKYIFQKIKPNNQ